MARKVFRAPRFFLLNFLSLNVDTMDTTLKHHAKRGINTLYQRLFSFTDSPLPPAISSRKISTDAPTPSSAFSDFSASPAGDSNRDGRSSSMLLHRCHALLNQIQTSLQVYHVADRYDAESHRLVVTFVVTIAVAVFTCWVVMRARHPSTSNPRHCVDDGRCSGPAQPVEDIPFQDSLPRQRAEAYCGKEAGCHQDNSRESQLRIHGSSVEAEDAAEDKSIRDSNSNPGNALNVALTTTSALMDTVKTVPGALKECVSSTLVHGNDHGHLHIECYHVSKTYLNLLRISAGPHVTLFADSLIQETSDTEATGKPAAAPSSFLTGSVSKSAASLIAYENYDKDHPCENLDENAFTNPEMSSNTTLFRQRNFVTGSSAVGTSDLSPTERPPIHRELQIEKDNIKRDATNPKGKDNLYQVKD